MSGSCHRCDSRDVAKVPMGYACFKCMVVSSGEYHTIPILREPELSWWMMHQSKSWKRASIEDQELLEEAYNTFLDKIIAK